MNERAAGHPGSYTGLGGNALRALIQEFVARDTENVTDVTRQLRRGEVQIVFDAASRAINIVGPLRFWTAGQ